jgi:hypothetical protein
MPAAIVASDNAFHHAQPSIVFLELVLLCSNEALE